MTRDGADVRPEEAQVKPTIGRRGMVAAAWAMVAAVVLRKRETSVEATSGGGADGTLVMGSNGASPNTSTATTLMLSASNFMHGEFYVFDSTGFQGHRHSQHRRSHRCREGNIRRCGGHAKPRRSKRLPDNPQRRCLWNVVRGRGTRSGRSSSWGWHGRRRPGSDRWNRGAGRPSGNQHRQWHRRLRAQLLVVHRRVSGRRGVRRVRALGEWARAGRSDRVRRRRRRGRRHQRRCRRLRGSVLRAGGRER